MIRLSRSTQISATELRAWAYDADPELPENADGNCWDLMVEQWFADDSLYCELAADPACAKREYVLAVLRYRLWRACRRTRWTSTQADILRGLPRAGVGSKGRGRREKVKREQQLADGVASNAEAAAGEHARRLLQLARCHSHPDLRELVARLQQFLADPTTICDPYWSEPPRL